MDDMLLFVKNKDIATRMLNEMSSEIEKNLLKVNPNSQLIPIKNGFNFLGWHFKFSSHGAIIQTVKQQTKRRIIQKCKSTIHKTQENKNQTLNSYIGWLKRSDSYYFSNKIKNILTV